MLNYHLHFFFFSEKGIGEMFSKAADLQSWGEPVSLSVTVDLVPDDSMFLSFF